MYMEILQVGLDWQTKSLEQLEKLKLMALVEKHDKISNANSPKEEQVTCHFLQTLFIICSILSVILINTGSSCEAAKIRREASAVAATVTNRISIGHKIFFFSLP